MFVKKRSMLREGRVKGGGKIKKHPRLLLTFEQGMERRFHAVLSL